MSVHIFQNFSWGKSNLFRVEKNQIYLLTSKLPVSVTIKLKGTKDDASGKYLVMVTFSQIITFGNALNDEEQSLERKCGIDESEVSTEPKDLSFSACIHHGCRMGWGLARVNHTPKMEITQNNSNSSDLCWHSLCSSGKNLSPCPSIPLPQSLLILNYLKESTSKSFRKSCPE